MKKLLAFLCLLVGGVITVNATITVYVKANTNPYIWAWGANDKNLIEGSKWPGYEMVNTKTVKGVEFYYYEFQDVETINFLLTDGAVAPEEPKKTSDQKGITSDIYVIYDGATGIENITAIMSHDYTVVGDARLLTESWKVDCTDNDMTSTDGKVFTWTKTDLPLFNDTYEFKVLQDHDSKYTNAWPPENYKLNIAVTGFYTVTITFNAQTKDVSAEATKTADVEIEKSYYVAGCIMTSESEEGGAGIFGEKWNPSLAANKMLLNSETNLYELVFNQVFDSSVNYAFKVVINNTIKGTDVTSYDWVGDAAGKNLTFAIPGAGKYNITITYDEGNNAVQPVSIVKELQTFTVTFVNGKEWANPHAHAFTGETPIAEWPGIKMTKTSGMFRRNGKDYDIYTVDIQAYDKPAKIIFNNGVVGEGSEQTSAQGETFVDGQQYSNVENIPVYAVVGSNADESDKLFFPANFNEAPTTTHLMTWDETTNKWTESFQNLELDAQTVKFKVISRPYLESTDVTWYPGGANKEIVISEAGKYNIVITFDGTNVEYTYNDTQEKFTVTSAGWATAVTYNAVDFSTSTKLTAYLATVSDSKVTLTEATQVPAGTPVVLKGETDKVTIIESAEAVINYLKGSNEHGWEITESEDARATFYGLTVSNGIAKFAKLNKGNIYSGKAYLEIPKTSESPSPARELSIIFAGGEANGINAIAAEKSVEGIYNMNGQRVAAPAKGLYIVNGKKVIMK